jgi:ABC-type methionine transport system ATPase subunit
MNQRESWILQILKKLNEDFGKTVVLVTHNPVVANIANRILNMKDGKLYNLEKIEFTNPFCPECYTTQSKGINYCSNCGKLITSSTSYLNKNTEEKKFSG